MLDQPGHIVRIVPIAILLCVLTGCRGTLHAREILFATIEEHSQVIALNRDSGDTQAVIPEAREDQNAAFPLWSPQGDAILYLVWDWDNGEAETSLWTMGPDGSNPRCIAPSTVNSTAPGAWSYDGRYVAYRTGTDHQSPSTWNLAITGVTALNTSEIVTGAWGYTWSPSEHLIAICRWAGDDSGLYVFGADGSQLYALAITETQHLSRPLLCGSNMTWRPNSWEIVFACEPSEGADFKELCVVDPRSGETQVLTQGWGNYSYRRVSSLAWAPDGQSVLFLADYGTLDGGEVQNALFVLDTTTGEERELANGLEGVAPVWSPNGEEIAFIAPGENAVEDHDTQVWVVRMQTGQVTQLTYDNTLKLSLSW